MKKRQLQYWFGWVLLMGWLAGGSVAWAQPTTVPMMPQQDTAKDKTNNASWKNETVNVTFSRLGSDVRRTPDTAIHTFHRKPFIQPWARDQGNPGSPVYNLMFTPDYHVGPTLGYHVFDVYRFNIDSLNYYTTSRPYSVFSYQAGGRQENIAGIMHTQNIKPNWNFAVDYRKVVSPGYYKIQRNNHDNAAFTTNYKSLDKHYALNAAVVYNKEQHDENGGVVNYDDFSDVHYYDRRTINTTYQNAQYSTLRSTVTNVQRDVSAMLQNSYTWGAVDTTYDKDDSDNYTYALTPRFSITQRSTFTSEQHTYKDLAPDSTRYTSLFDRSFPNKGGGYYVAGSDSVFTRQKWVRVDNKILLSGFLGHGAHLLGFSAGAGVRYDQFISNPAINYLTDSPYTRIGYDRMSRASTYVEGQLGKEALHPGAWEYKAAVQFFTSGQYAGNFNLDASLGKRLGKDAGSFRLGAKQQVGSAPYSYTTYQNVYTSMAWSFTNESVTILHATADLSHIRLSGGVRGNVISNFIYMNTNGLPAQYTVPFTIPQVWLRKVFRLGSFYLDNEIVVQQVGDNIPVNVPLLMGRHQLSFERPAFHSALTLATGIECRYNTAYKPAMYNAQFNRFCYQDSLSITNFPELRVFLNFRIKRFRAFIMGDNLQQLFARNAILFTTTPINGFGSDDRVFVPVYAMPNAVFRFGFSWVMVN